MFYELTIADKRHDPTLANPKHGVGDTIYISNVRLLRGKWTRVAEWWYLKNKSQIDKLVQNGQVVIRNAGEQPTSASSTVPAQQESTEAKEDDFSVFGLRAHKTAKLKELASTYLELAILTEAELVEKAGLSQAQAEKVAAMARELSGGK